MSNKWKPVLANLVRGDCVEVPNDGFMRSVMSLVKRYGGKITSRHLSDGRYGCWILRAPKIKGMYERREIFDHDICIRHGVAIPPDIRGCKRDGAMWERYRVVLQEHAMDTLETTGKVLGLTRERVRQLYNDLGVNRRVGASKIWKQFPTHRVDGKTYFKTDEIESYCAKVGVTSGAAEAVLRTHGVYKMTRSVVLGMDNKRWCSICHQPVPIKDFQGYRRCKSCNRILSVFQSRKRRWDAPGYRMRGSKHDSSPIMVRHMMTLPQSEKLS